MNAETYGGSGTPIPVPDAPHTETPPGVPEKAEPQHKFCERCLTRAQRRQLKRDSKRRNSKWQCCAVDPRTGARLHSLGKHNHSAQQAAHDHPTGERAWTGDPSMTRAVRARLTR